MDGQDFWEVMEKRIHDSKDELVRTEEATPVCGQVFCVYCGDCLYCYEEDECFRGPWHVWVECEE